MIALLLAASLGQGPLPPTPTPDRVASLAWSPDGSRIAVAVGQLKAGEPGRVELRDEKSGAVKWRKDLPGAAMVAFTADGKRLLAAGATLRIYDPADGATVVECPHDSAVLAVAVGPKDRFASAGEDRTVRVWDAATFKEVLKIESKPEPLFRLAISPEGLRIAGSSQRPARSADRKASVSSTLWDAMTGDVVKPFDDASSYVGGLAFSADGRWLVRCVSNSASLTVNDAVTGAEVCRFGAGGGIDRFALDPRTGRVVTAGVFDESLTVYELRFTPLSPDERMRIDALIARFDADAIADREAAAKELLPFGLAAEPQLKKAMTESPNAEIRLRARKALIHWRDKGHRTIKIAGGRASALALSPDGTFAAQGSANGTIRIVELEKGTVVAEWKP